MRERSAPLAQAPLARAAGALGLGAALVLAFSPYDLWFVAVVVAGLLALLLRGQAPGRSAVYGFLAGLGFFVTLLPWIGEEVGPIPWLILAAFEALFFAPLGAVLALVQRLPGWPFWTACAWVAEEALRGRVPYGGFTWGRLAFSQADGPLLPLAALGGAPLVTSAVALAGGLLGWGVLRRPLWQRLLAIAAAAAITSAGPLFAPTSSAGDTVTVAVIQGNVPQLGLEFNERRRAITANHADLTRRLADEVASGRVTQPDAVIWPENSVDINPYADAETRAAISAAVDVIDAPTLVGALVPTADEQNVQNTSIVWQPGEGPGLTYVKRHPMPFGEYIPFRSVARLISPAVDRQPRDFVAGTQVGVLPMGPARVGSVICFEVAFDNLVRDAVRAGSDLLAVQTNNATFGFTPMTEQQLAMARLRAVEHGRTVLVAALSGVSAVVGPDGAVRDRAEVFTQQALVADVELARSRTSATTAGEWPEWILTALVVGAAAAALLLPRGRRPDHVSPAGAEPATVEAR
ncbi:MAG: apolipoprotein N-acyltransferase [Jiangellaceae bacterium]|nr:apolipoprotein N-acyltransferase [Jiangellaceae bacterium]